MNASVTEQFSEYEVSRRIRGRRRRTARRGITIVIVLGLLAIAMAVSYTMLRTQSTAVQVSRNVSRQTDARQAANTGMSAALRRIHEKDWVGVDDRFIRQIGKDEGFKVTIETGDVSLTPEHPDYGEFPFRLTLTSTGYTRDPANPSVWSEHKIKVVVQLVRRALSKTPSNWNELQDYTIHQWTTKTSYVQFPVRAEGPVLLNGRLRLCDEYPDLDTACLQYLNDLEAMRADGQGDFRPVTGPVSLPYDRNDSSTLALLSRSLNVKTQNVAASNTEPLSRVGTVLSYKLYPGGKEYSVPSIQEKFGTTLQNKKIEPDPIENPLGIYRSPENLYLRDNVTIRGTIIGGQADVHILGSDVHLQAVSLPSLEDSKTSIQLPVALVGDDLRVHETCRNSSMTGMVVTWDDFEFRRGDDDVSFDVQGRLLVHELKLHGRDSWDLSASKWSELLADFLDQLNDPRVSNPIRYFPQWLEKHQGLAAKPLLTIKPQSSEVTYHWQNWDYPIYAPHPDDEGLRWDLIDWQDNP